MADVKELNQYVVEWARAREQESDGCFPVYVRLVRRCKGITRSVLAAQTGIKESTLVAIENDLISKEKIESDQLQKLEMCLGMSYQDFLKMYSKKLSRGSGAQAYTVNNHVPDFETFRR